MEKEKEEKKELRVFDPFDWSWRVRPVKRLSYFQTLSLSPASIHSKNQ